jgi:methionyl-tRNA synthetase
MEGVKISKSGRTLDPSPVIARHGADALRWFLLRHVRTARDGDFSEARFTETYDAELANGLGNLAARVFTLAELASEGRIPATGPETPEDAGLRAAGEALPGAVAAAFDGLAIDQAAQVAFGYVDETNRYLNRSEPWKLLRTGRVERARSVVRTALEALGVVAVELEPFLPAAASTLLVRLARAERGDERPWGRLEEGALLGRGDLLFARSARASGA